MQKRTVKAAVAAAMAGTLLFFGGCLGVILQQAVVEVFAEQVAGLLPNILPAAGG